MKNPESAPIRKTFLCLCGRILPLGEKPDDTGKHELECVCGEIWQVPVFPKAVYRESGTHENTT